MAKKGEIEYIQAIGAEGTHHALNKPFSDPLCGQYLTDLGVIFSLLPSPPAKLLDLGCGSGWTSVFFAKRGYTVVGQDICNDMIELAERNKLLYQATSVNFITSDYEGMSYQAEFDCAVFYDSLHHAEDEYLALQRVFNALKVGGILITAEPGQGHSKAPASKHAMEKYGVTEKDMPPSHIIKLSESIGFSRYKLYKRLFNPQLIWESNNNVNNPSLLDYLSSIKLRNIKNMIKSGIPKIEFNASNILVLVK
jgi:SAM-dependent methyltransferase